MSEGADMPGLLGPLLITSYSQNYLANLLLLAIISFMRRLSGGANTPYNLLSTLLAILQLKHKKHFNFSPH